MKKARAKLIRSLSPCLKRSALIWKHIEEAERQKRHFDIYEDIHERRQNNARQMKKKVHRMISDLKKEQELILSL